MVIVLLSLLKTARNHHLLFTQFLWDHFTIDGCFKPSMVESSGSSRWRALKKWWLGRSICFDWLNMIQMSDVKKRAKNTISLNIFFDFVVGQNHAFKWWRPRHVYPCFDPVITDISIVSMDPWRTSICRGILTLWLWLTWKMAHRNRWFTY